MRIEPTLLSPSYARPARLLFFDRGGPAHFYGICTGGRYNCNNQLGIDPSNTLVIKYAPSSQTLSVAAEVCHVEQHSTPDKYAL